MPAPKRHIAEVGRGSGVAGAPPGSVRLDHRLGKPLGQAVFAGEVRRVVWLVFRIIHRSVKAHVGSRICAQDWRAYQCEASALVAALGPLRAPVRLQSEQALGPSPDQRNKGPSPPFAGVEFTATGAIDMDGNRNSVLEARWLLAVPASVLLTVLIAGLLLG